MNKNCEEKNYEQKLGTKIGNKSCEQKFLTKVVDKSCEQRYEQSYEHELWT